MAKRDSKTSASRSMHIPGLNFGERQALRHYAEEAGMTPEELVRELITESAWEVALIKRNGW